VKFVLSERSRVGKRLPDIVLFEVWQFLDDLRWCHAVRDEVDNVRNRDAKAADRRAPGENIRVLRDAIECVHHCLYVIVAQR